MQIILGDYVGAILGLARDGLDWRLNPLEVSAVENPRPFLFIVVARKCGRLTIVFPLAGRVTLSPSSSILCIAGMPRLRQRTPSGQRIYFESCSQAKISIRCEHGTRLRHYRALSTRLQITVDDFKHAAHKHMISDGKPRGWTFEGCVHLKCEPMRAS